MNQYCSHMSGVVPAPWRNHNKLYNVLEMGA